MVVVEVEGRRLLVGAAANQMSVLAELSGATTGDAESQEPEPSAIPPRPGLSGVGVSGVAFDSLLSARDTGDSSSLVDRVRSMTIRTLDPNLRRRPGTPRLRIGRER